MVISTRKKRALNFLIDTVFSVLLLVIFLLIFLPKKESSDSSLQIMGVMPLISSILIVNLYYFLGELVFSKTIGKVITSTVVVTHNFKKPNFLAILLRTLLRNVPLEFVTFLLDNRPQGLHDYYSKTFVVEETS